MEVARNFNSVLSEVLDRKLKLERKSKQRSFFGLGPLKYDPAKMDAQLKLLNFLENKIGEVCKSLLDTRSAVTEVVNVQRQLKELHLSCINALKDPHLEGEDIVDFLHEIMQVIENLKLPTEDIPAQKAAFYIQLAQYKYDAFCFACYLDSAQEKLDEMYKSMIGLYNAAAKAEGDFPGDPEAMYRYVMLYKGLRFRATPGLKLIHEYLQRASDLGHIGAKARYLKYLFEGRPMYDIAQDLSKAYTLYQDVKVAAQSLPAEVQAKYFVRDILIEFGPRIEAAMQEAQGLSTKECELKYGPDGTPITECKLKEE